MKNYDMLSLICNADVNTDKVILKINLKAFVIFTYKNDKILQYNLIHLDYLNKGWIVG